MKNAIIYGLFIGVLSGIWLFIMHKNGLQPQTNGAVKPIELASVIIPMIGLYFGLRSYRKNECEGKMGFLEALIQGFKILLVGGVIASAGSIIYIEEFMHGANLLDFSGRIFAALLVGVLFCLGFSLMLATASNKVD